MHIVVLHSDYFFSKPRCMTFHVLVGNCTFLSRYLYTCIYKVKTKFIKSLKSEHKPSLSSFTWYYMYIILAWVTFVCNMNVFYLVFYLWYLLPDTAITLLDQLYEQPKRIKMWLQEKCHFRKILQSPMHICRIANGLYFGIFHQH